MIFLVLSGKMMFFSPENMILFFRQKIKDDFSQKNTWKYDVFSKCSEKMVFPKISHWNMIFLVLSGKMVLFYRTYDIFSLDGKSKMIFLRKYMEIWYFLYIYINVTNMILPFCQKNERRSSPEKIHLKVIDILDWHPKKISNDSLHFYGDLHRRFHILLSSERKKQET